MEEKKLINITIPICGWGSHGYKYCYKLWEHAYRQGSQYTMEYKGTSTHKSFWWHGRRRLNQEVTGRHPSVSGWAESDLSLELLQELLSNIQCVLPFKNVFKYLCAFRFLENDDSYSRGIHIYRKPEDLKLSLQPNCWILCLESEVYFCACKFHSLQQPHFSELRETMSFWQTHSTKLFKLLQSDKTFQFLKFLWK